MSKTAPQPASSSHLPLAPSGVRLPAVDPGLTFPKHYSRARVIHPVPVQGGFTLLEVLIGLVIIGISFSVLFGGLAGVKRLIHQSSDSVTETRDRRAAINAGQLLGARAVNMGFAWQEQGLSLEVGKVLEKPPLQTRPLRFVLEPYVLRGVSGEVVLRSSRWIVKDLP